ncbi:uncharacterized protein IL334_001742 [Kwoniella shivajii]|uniref:HTH La-type RNA-binding domain-containing protein n=1 Tax=Kwoniella shivajii TaxID=564305 RepID=A0ABZ1CSR7_9TREE|nr:hypothetical protein IL334_001742 [Kwoniella shivajii]
MIAVQFSPPSLSAFPVLAPHLLPSTMPTSQQVINGQQPSAFNALGSYADRIKDINGNPTKLTAVPGPSSSNTTKINTSKTSSPAPSTAPSSSSSTVKAREPKSTSTQTSVPKPSQSQVQEHDEQWETVKSSRQRIKQQEEKEKHGSNSKNWRDRSHREGAKQKNGDDTEKKSSHGHGKSSKKSGTHTTLSNPTPAIVENNDKPASTTSAPTKPAWTALTQPTQTTSTPKDDVPNQSETAKDTTQQGSTVPSSPSLNGTTVTANSASVPPSIGSPHLSSETASTSTASTSVLSKAVDKLEEDGSWRARTKSNVEERAQPAPAPTTAQPVQAAPPPSVNAWELRKKLITPVAHSSTSGAPSQAKQLSSGPAKDSTQRPVLNGHAKEEASSKSKKKTSARAVSSAALPSINDATLWPDVSQAAVVVKVTEDKREKPKEKSGQEDASVTEDGATGTSNSKKPKWTPIPASELLAAVDQAADATRRQNRAEVNAKKRAEASKGEGEPLAAGTKGGRSKKGVVIPSEGKKGGVKAGIAGSTTEAKAPSIQTSSQGVQNAIQANGEPVSNELVRENDTVGVQKGEKNDENSAVPSSQTTGETKVVSPRKDDAQLSSPNGTAPNMRLGSGPLQSRPMTGSSTAPLPQHAFNPANNHNLPRVPRGRDARGSFNGRGRGGFRSNSAMVHKAHGFGSPPLGGASGLPIDGFANGNGLQRGFGGFQSFYPVQGYGQVQAGAGIYDPTQAQYGAVYRAGLPPPPMPQTVVPNLDATRFYVLGQVEYYFSMQNLAMDFFLRQQMDSEGWIDIAMIASFNRLKSLTPEVSIVKECMMLSALLEVKEESVRLAGTDAQRWVLPDAKSSKFSPDPTSPSQDTEESKEGSTSLDQSLGNEDGSVILNQLATNLPRNAATVAADVENALMKSSNPVSTVPVTNGDEVDKQEDVNPTDGMTVEEEAKVEKVEENVMVEQEKKEVEA